MGEDPSKIISPRVPFHKRMELYIKKRNDIFNVADIQCSKKPKKSTIRLRTFYKKKRLWAKIQISSIVSNPQDMRYYAKVSFLNYKEYGLLDTGANVSCIGGDLAQKDFTKFPNFVECKSFVKTADGNCQKVLGWISTNITFKNKTNIIKLYIIPTISQRLILGIDFWKAFNLFQNVLETADILACNNGGIYPLDISSMNVLSDQQDLEDSSDSFIALSYQERKQLDSVI